MVARQLVEAADSLHSVITHDFECDVLIPKSQLLASTQSLLLEVCKGFGKHRGNLAPYAANLGIDFSLGRARQMFSKSF
eukprot:8671871-Heterocapsa_arctica.AAC.1